MACLPTVGQPRRGVRMKNVPLTADAEGRIYSPPHEADSRNSVRRRRRLSSLRRVHSFMSSGNLQADRRLEVALALKGEGEFEAAASVIEQALELVPGWPEARFALGETQEAAGRRDAAVAAYVACLAGDAGDRMGAGLRLALLGAAPVPDAAPQGYVRMLFDQYAPRFERSLLGRLAYRGPWQMREAVDEVRPADRPRRRALDIGCGTGLSGEAFRDAVSWLEGVDLSPRMIAEARRKGLYDRLVEGEALSLLRAAKNGRYDLVLAADMIIYLGELSPLFAAVGRVLSPAGLFALTAQRADGGAFVLGREMRYSHAPEYLRRAAGDAGLETLLMREAVSRTENGADVPGLVCVFMRPAALAAGAPFLPTIGDRRGRARE